MNSRLKNVIGLTFIYLQTVCCYFWGAPDQACVKAVLLKCMPILCLVVFLILLENQSSDKISPFRNIKKGLLFSAIGDAFLVYPNLFVYGMAAFALAQVSYIISFRCEHSNLPTAAIIYSTSALGLYHVMPGVHDDLGLKIGVPIYTLLLSTMTWRAITMYLSSDGKDKWPNLCAAVGAVFFFSSDTMIGIDSFYSNFPYAHTMVMVTYYVAQLGIALSAMLHS